MRGNNLFLKLELLCIRSLQKLSSTDLMYSTVSYSLLREGKQKFSPNCSRPVISLGIGMLQVLTNQFVLGSNSSVHFSLKLIGFNSIMWESVKGSWRNYMVVWLTEEQKYLTLLILLII